MHSAGEKCIKANKIINTSKHKSTLSIKDLITQLGRQYNPYICDNYRNEHKYFEDHICYYINNFNIINEILSTNIEHKKCLEIFDKKKFFSLDNTHHLEDLILHYYIISEIYKKELKCNNESFYMTEKDINILRNRDKYINILQNGYNYFDIFCAYKNREPSCEVGFVKCNNIK